MISFPIVLALEGILVFALSLGAAYALHASHISDEIAKGVSYFYPLSTLQVAIVIFFITALVGILFIFTSGTRGLKWFIAPVLILTLPSIVSRSGIPEYLREQFIIETDIDILSSDISTSSLLLLSMLLVSGFLLLFQLLMLREMHEGLISQGVGEYDITNIYKTRILSSIIILLCACLISYTIFRYASNLKTAIRESISFTPFMSLAIGVFFAFIAIAILFRILLLKRRGLEVREPKVKKGIRSKFTYEALSVVTIAIPTSVSIGLSRLLKRIAIRTVHIIVRPILYIFKIRNCFMMLGRIRPGFQRRNG